MRISDWSSDVCSSDLSMSIELIHSPPDLITSLLRSVTRMKPLGSIVAMSPVSNQPSPSSADCSSRKYRSITKGPRALSTPGVSPSHGREAPSRSEEHTSELQSLMTQSYADFFFQNYTTTHR